MQRQLNESFEDYKVRRKQTQQLIKAKLSGRWFYDTYKTAVKKGLIVVNVPYVNEHKEPKATSFTENLRNERGYAKHLKSKGVQV